MLIFTQMTKMLNILEHFLNLHGHTYVRLDGSTKVEQRQHLMERFNNDPKLFVFILSTRSGGLGINLTGADTVIFYDTDWNPAMDAQAQDRAHRIGQTRDVHIYRLVTSQTVEENILLKASQKRDLSRLSIEEGLFTTMSLMANEMKNGEDKKSKTKSSYLASVIQGKSSSSSSSSTKIEEIEDDAPIFDEGDEEEEKNMTSMLNAEEMQAAMASVEDVADANASKQIASEMKAQGVVDLVSKEDNEAESKLQRQEAEESEKMKWISSSDQALKQMEDSLPPIHRFALQYRTEIDRPESSLTALSPEALADAMAKQQSAEIEAALNEQSEIEAMMLEPEGRMELDAAALVDPKRDERLTSSQRRNLMLKCEASYWSRRRRMRNERRQRRLQGASWTPYIDERSGRVFWYNIDTGKSQWDKPAVIIARDALRDAHILKYSGLPQTVLLNILRALAPYPDHHAISLVCKRWHKATQNRCLEIVVNQLSRSSSSKSEMMDSMRAVETFVPRSFTSLSAAVAYAPPGATIRVHRGIYHEPAMCITKPLRIVAAQSRGSTGKGGVEILFRGSLTWEASGGELKGLNLCHPRLETFTAPNLPHIIEVCGSSTRLDLDDCHVSNMRGTGACVAVSDSATLSMRHCLVSGSPESGVIVENAQFLAVLCEFSQNQACGVVLLDRSVSIIRECKIRQNHKFGIRIFSDIQTSMQRNKFQGNRLGPWDLLNGELENKKFMSNLVQNNNELAGGGELCSLTTKQKRQVSGYYRHSRALSGSGRISPLSSSSSTSRSIVRVIRERFVPPSSSTTKKKASKRRKVV